ncbi:acyl-[acyl-carrier-protein] thioesterase [Peptoniphilus sp. AGMB00490]|uniref:Acyl-[acyl-carrier-protein] thioesterase n=1 Tax=Peptoniphilus faecalis TaxID=2731255 RepID=A0A848RG21_9FIRM|nr:acyl-ACP thioesterase domain-containing protein [Peptoniphilus faecalis]NMW84651.1 acyl-[acyl-carrier-protein] thioesterase [Peptoniphilus faecalis]
MNIYEREFVVEDFLCKKGELSLNYIINYFMETSNCQSISLGEDSDNLINKGYTWMIYKWFIKILKYPKAYQRIKVKTWASGFKGINAFREFEMYVEGERIVSASSNFILIDLKKRKPIKIPKEISKIYSINDVKNFDKIERVNEPKDIETINIFDYKILKSDIDINNHMNNSVYAKLLYEALPESFYNIKFTDVNINYVKELKYGDHVCIYVYLEDDKLYFFFKNKEKSELYARACCHYIS